MRAFIAVDNVLRNLKQGKYPIREENTQSLLAQYNRIQVRAENDNPEKIDRIVAYVKETDDYSQFDPISVVCDENGKVIALVDGNHTLQARGKLEKCIMTPAIHIPYSDLWYEKANAVKLGNALNVVVKQQDESSDESIKNMMRTDMANDINISSDEYKMHMHRLVKRPLKGIGKMVSTVIGTNDQTRRLFTKDDLNKVKEEHEEDGLTVVINSTHGASGGQALGSLLKQMFDDDTQRGLILLYHRSFNHESRYKDIVKQLEITTLYHELDIEIEFLEFPKKD